MLKQVIEMLQPKQDDIYVDMTVGLGGHAEALLGHIGPAGRLIGIDRDQEALEIAGQKLSDRRVTLKRGSFTDMENLLNAEGISAVDGILFDLGVSMLQLKDRARGFSFLSGERLDMRMDRRQEVSAWEIVNRYPEQELERIFREYGEERFSRKIARTIVSLRNRKSINTCSELAEVVAGVYRARSRVNPATRTFQALRIAVNRELDQLRDGLHASLRVLKEGGRLCVISYHSLEDRIVKQFIAGNAKNGRLKMLTKKPLVPSAEELKMNLSARSAKLRAAEKIS